MMELTLTGASLNENNSGLQNNDQNNEHAKKEGSSAVVEGSATAADNSLETVSKMAVASAQAGGHKKKCCHGKDGGCSNSNEKPPDLMQALNVEEMLKTKPAQLMPILVNILKGGQFAAFEKVAKAILDHEKTTGQPLIKQPPSLLTNTNNNIPSPVSSLAMHVGEGHTLPHWAAKRADDVRFMEYLAKEVPSINLNMVSTDSVGMRPLHWAATEGSIPLVALILKHLQDVNKSSTSSSSSSTVKAAPTSSLMEAYNNDEEDDSNSNSMHNKDAISVINARDKSGCTPLLIASQYGHADLVAFLIRRGADPNAMDDSRDTALHWAAYKGSVPVCGLLLHLNGVDTQLSFKDVFGQSPLHLASLRGNSEVVRYLVETAETNTENKKHSSSGNDQNSLSRIGSRSTNNNSSPNESYSALPKALLTMCDREGKTPLDLANKKKRTACEIILKEYMDKHCNSHASSKLKFWIKSFCSMSNWKVWLGFNGANINAHPPKAIFWFVVINTFIITVVIEYTLFLPIIRTSSSTSEGRLWDFTLLNAFRFLSYISMWVFFLLVHYTDPGILASKDKANANSSSLSTILTCNENDRIKTAMDKLTNELKQSYNQSLDSFAEVYGSASKQNQVSFCHTCHIIRPLRSKHCRVLNRCVLLFDHHCPFLGSTIGLYNYRYFLMYLLTFLTSEIFFVITWVTYEKRAPTKEWGKIIMFVYCTLYSLMVISLLFYHTSLIAKNLSTNEHQNIWRYRYLRDEFGRFHNVFDKGRFANLMSRLFPSPECYVIPGQGSPNVQTSFNGKNAKSSTDDEKQDLLHKIV